MNRQYTTPQSNDILAGRSKSAFKHPGNVLLRETVCCRLDEYCEPQGSRKRRLNLIREILESIKSQGGRFLKFDSDQGEWYDAGYKEARYKISHAFRDASIPNKVKCIEKMRCQYKPQPMSITMMQERSLDAQREECCASQSNEDLEPLLHTAIPRVSLTFAYFTGFEGEQGADLRELDEFLDNLDVEEELLLGELLDDSF